VCARFKKKVLCSSTVVDGFQWSSPFANGFVIYACANESVTFPWTYVTSSGEDIIEIEWYAVGHSEELVAILTHGHFVPLATFSRRVQVSDDD
jgi:hypothetical protein